VLSTPEPPAYEDGDNVTFRPENRPTIEIRLVVVHRPHDGSAVARVQVQTRAAEWATLSMQEWPSGRPTPPQLLLLGSVLAEHAQQTIEASLGVQGVF
jgi:hypothetical protein